MNMIDSLFAKSYMVAMILVAVYFVSTIVLALRNKPGQWTVFSQLAIVMGTISGRSLILCALISLGTSLLFKSMGLPQTALWIVYGTMFFVVTHFACYITRSKMRKMRLVSDLTI